MKRQFITPLIVAAAVALGQAGCSSPGTPKRLAKAGSSKKEMTFPEDVAFLQKHVEVITLGQGEGQPQVAIVPAYQGRVMTSTVGGDETLSHGWINYDLIASGKLAAHQRFRRRGPFLAWPGGWPVFHLLQEWRSV